MVAVVSILTPSFNREDLVAETLDSIQAQTYSLWENIIVDDGSSDRTKEIIADYAARDPRFILHDRDRAPKGACTCRNIGFSQSTGAYVLFLDTDDLIEPFCLAQRVAAMESDPGLDFAIFPSLMFEHTPHDLGLWWNIDKPEDELARQFKQDAICQGTGVLWRREAFERIGMWDEGLALWQDIDLFFRAFIQDFRYAKFFDLPPDLHNRVNPTSLSRGRFLAPEKTRSRVDVVRRAVRLLKENGKGDRVREARHMTAEIASGLARSNQPRAMARELFWAWREGVMTSAEALAAALSGSLYASRATRLPAIRRLADGVAGSLDSESTLGRLPHIRETEPTT